MYQLYAYGTKYINCKKMYLIYPYNNNDFTLRYLYKNEENDKLVLNLLFFDLSKDDPVFYNQYNSEVNYKLFEKLKIKKYNILN